ncbi:hypothetical protein FRB94_014221 [Tulasnella sp. JGI-2019a]|nr:hypothetical protein FRB93_005432 [Tulasnella sp. JGI-2019a]KAG9014128.1 hypothetical protein FRB94_014221 [Tulasnella sp. JGI-2019a]KAG9027529.1 hypothetical protein FRB95_007630 [Tulasnella sp. JGI-2019a]
MLGTVLTSQAVLGIIALRKTHVPTWSSSPLDVTAALVHYRYIQRRQNRCMHSSSQTDDERTDPIRPSPRQPSLWMSHKSVQRVINVIWGVAAFFVLSGSVLLLGWSPYRWGKDEVAPPLGLLRASLELGVVQSVVAIALHCGELVITLARDEQVWREASKEHGARLAGNPLKALFGNWQSCGFLLCKIVVHWIFGQTMHLRQGTGLVVGSGFGGKSQNVLGGALIFVAWFITFIATRQPLGPQPAAYGHVQTLADLIDEWSTRMHWGHKADGWGVGPWPVGRAGTAKDKPLPRVKMDLHYA